MAEYIEPVVIREDEIKPGDRRVFPRATCEYSTEFVDPGTGLTIKGTVLDISRGGMRVKTVGPARIADTERLRFYLFINGSMLKIHGAVVRQSTDGYLGVEFKSRGDTMQDRLDRHVSDAAHRNTRIEFRTRVYEDLTPSEQPNMRAVARSIMRGGGHTIHEGMAAAKSVQQSGTRKWLDRRVATHLTDLSGI